MMDITRGSLDDIARPARSSRHRPGSRVSLNSGLASPINRPVSCTSSSMEILPPEPDILLQEDNDLAIVEYLTSSDEEEQEGPGLGTRAEGVFHVGGLQDRMRQLDLLLAKTDGSASEQEEDAFHTHSEGPDDAHDLTFENGYQEEPGAHCASRSSSKQGQEPQEEEEEDPDADLAAITDPELRKAIKKMRKLDRILNTKVTREKEVKRQRKMLHHQLEVELDSIKQEGGGKSKEATENTTRFLALVPPVSHDEGVNMEDIPSTPVFATQPPEGSPAHRASTASSSNQSSPRGRSGRPDRRASKTSPRDARNQRRPRPPGSGTGGGPGSKEEEPDFIQRNIQLASDAGNLIAMTDDEKKRLEDLLKDVNMLQEENEEVPMGTSLQLNQVPGLGYTPDEDSQKLLQDIDEKLKHLLPLDDFSEICSTPSLIGDRRGSIDPEAFDLGERILWETKSAKTQQQRLQDIGKELEQLQSQVEMEISSPSLSRNQLHSLLQRCSEASDRTMTEITSPRLPQQSPTATSPRQPGSTLPSSSPRSSHGSSLPPGGAVGKKLSDDTLQELLAEAKASLGMLALENAGSSRATSQATTTDGYSRATSQAMTGRDSRASSRTGSTLTTAREGTSQLGLSLTDSPRSEISINTSRSLVSHDVIQQLLKNPRATMLQSSRQGALERYHREEEEEEEEDDEDILEMDDDELNASLDI